MLHSYAPVNNISQKPLKVMSMVVAKERQPPEEEEF